MMDICGYLGFIAIFPTSMYVWIVAEQLKNEHKNAPVGLLFAMTIAGSK